MADLKLGPDPDSFSFTYVVGDPWTARLIFSVGDDETPTTWPGVPVLEFGDDYEDPQLVWTPVLEDEDDVEDAVAVWNQDEDDVADLHALAKKKVRLSVDGVTWFYGTAVKRAS